jgi:type III pantothenate kinase
MLLLTLDLGNTTLDCMVHRGDSALARVRLRGADAAALQRFVAEHRPAAAVGVAVRGREIAALARVLAASGVRLAMAGVDLACPLASRYVEPGALGADRWVAALAAHRLVGAAIVVDCGTALTVDAVSAEGVFLGGCIAPGLGTIASGLAARAPALPAVDPRGRVALPALTSADAVNAGTVLGFCGMVGRLVADLRAATGLHEAPGLLTGGDAEVVQQHAGLSLEPVPDLVHQGLRRLWQELGSRC